MTPEQFDTIIFQKRKRVQSKDGIQGLIVAVDFEIRVVGIRIKNHTGIDWIECEDIKEIFKETM